MLQPTLAMSLSGANFRRSPDAFHEILTFWFDEAGPAKWFGGGPEFDAAIAARFGSCHEAAAAGRLDHWRARPGGALALIIVLDQFSRNLFRNDRRAFAEDEKALALAKNAIARRFDMIAPEDARAFFYMPIMHSESLKEQETCCTLFKARMPASMNVPFAEEHKNIIEKFGRFPHRNKLLGRTPTAAETAFLKAGGFSA